MLVAMQRPEKHLGRLKALADTTRLGIVTLLNGGERCVCELQDALDIRQSLLSFHLKTLKDAGIVADRRDGRWVHYSLNPDALAELEGFLRETRTPKSMARAGASSNRAAARC